MILSLTVVTSKAEKIPNFFVLGGHGPIVHGLAALSKKKVFFFCLYNKGLTSTFEHNALSN